MPDEYYLYLRKSIGRAGVGRQRTITTAHLQRTGARVTAEYTDTDRTAYAKPGQPPPPREDFRRMLAALRPGIGIAAWHADRLLRDGEDTAVFTRACINAGVTIIETARGGTYDLSTATGRKRLRDDASDAQYEVDHARERILAQQAEMRADGRWSGGRRPFGWQVDSSKPGGLVLNVAEAKLVRDGTAAVIAGATLTGLAREWAAATGRPWNHILVRQVLARPLNAALVSLGGEICGDGAWPAIVTAQQWRACRAVLADPARRLGPGPQRRYLLSGIALCGTCGAALGIGAAAGAIPQYRCRARLARDPRGAHANRFAAPLDEFTAALAKARLKRRDAAGLLRADHGAERAALLEAKAGLEARKAGQWQLYKSGVISDLELTDGRREIAAALAVIRDRRAVLDQADALAPMIADPEAAWERAGLEQRRAVVAALMYITVFPARRGRPEGTPRAGAWFDVDSVDVRWVRRLASDG